MTKIIKAVAIGAMLVTLAQCKSAFAQVDLDALLEALDGEVSDSAAKPAAAKTEGAAEEKPAAAKPVEQAAEKPAEAEKTEADTPAEPAAEKPAEKVADAEEPAKESEPAAVEETAAAEPAAEPAAEAADEVAEAEPVKEETAAEPAAEPEKEATEKEETAAVEPAAAEPEEEATAAAEPEAKSESAAEIAEAAPAQPEPAAASEQSVVEELAKETGAAAKQPTAKPASPKPLDPDAELVENLSTSEKLRREAHDTQAIRDIVTAQACMEKGDYKKAIAYFARAQKLFNDRPLMLPHREACENGLREAYYRAAMLESELGNRPDARKMMEEAQKMRHPKAAQQLKWWDDESADKEEVVDVGERLHRQNEEDYKLNREQIRRHLRRSRHYLAVRDLQKALEECEIVLVSDPYNADAIRIRKAIEKKRKVTLAQERDATREGLIAEVDEKWRPVYAVNAARLNETATETVKKQTGEDPERTQEQEIEHRMKEMKLPTISFKPPATIIDAVEFFRSASKDYDRPDKPEGQRGFNFVLKTPQGALRQQMSSDDESSNDFTSNDSGEDSGTSNGLPPIPTITASDITFYEALKLVCDSVDYKFIVRGPVVMVMHKDMSTAELLSRKYDVLDAFLERMTSASADVKEMRASGFGGGSRRTEDTEENQEKDWKGFFEQMGVKWPEGSSIMYIKTLGKLYVRNTRENLAEFEKVLQEMGSQPKLIEIETRFVEVSQEDLNSLGFEWILNSDYSLNVGKKLGKALGLAEGQWGGIGDSSKYSQKGSYAYQNGVLQPGGGTSSTFAESLERFPSGSSQGAKWSKPVSIYDERGNLVDGGVRGLGINAFGGTSDYSNGSRYLSTTGNHISGEGSTNDQFMRVNAFLGQADLSMILHMLSQRSDTDLLSAPKVVTKSGEQAIIKVVTEYIYPEDYDVQLQSSSSSSGGGMSGGGGQSAILAVVEPQNFKMREVGVILDVTPTYSEANGGTIDLELNPSVVELAQWYNYGMKIPFTGNSSLTTFEGLAQIPGAAVEAITALGRELTDTQKETYQSAIMTSSLTAMNSIGGAGSMTWYEAPMQQPFFHTRSINSKVSITPGATVVMGGLITEQRKAMDDKIPFLGDLPYIGRLFRSHAEQTIKRNLLIFVTGRLITPAGRELSVTDETAEDAEVKPAPAAQ